MLATSCQLCTVQGCFVHDEAGCTQYTTDATHLSVLGLQAMEGALVLAPLLQLPRGRQELLRKAACTGLVSPEAQTIAVMDELEHMQGCSSNKR